MLHPYSEHPSTLLDGSQGMRLGKDRARFDRRTLRLAKYVAGVTPPPAECYFQERIGRRAWGMYLNDTLGDCVIAAAAHMELQWSTYAGTAVTPTDAQVLSGYELVGGYVPGNPGTDNGCDMLTALTDWRKTGLCGKTVTAFALCGPVQGLKMAVALFGNAYIGIQLPLSAQGQNGWHVDDSDPEAAVPGSWGGHCVPVVGYNGNSLTVVTWGAILNMSWAFAARYMDESYAVLSPEWIEANGESVSGFDMGQLTADLAVVTA